MGAIGTDTPVQELDLTQEAVRRELFAMLPTIARVPLGWGGLPTTSWFEQFDEEEPNDPLTADDLLAKATFSVTSGHELQVHGRRERCLDRDGQSTKR